MLHIKHHHMQFRLPQKHFVHMPHKMHLAPVMADNDEILAELEEQRSARDDNWELSEPINATSLERYWSQVTSADTQQAE